MTSFAHLRVHSEYSLVDSVVRIAPLLEQVKNLSMPAVALTDQGNVSAMVRFYRAAIRRGVKPVIGADLWVGNEAGDRQVHRLSLLCQNRDGLKNLSRLLTAGYAQGQVQGRAVVRQEWLTTHALDGLIVLSGAQFGELGQALLSADSQRAAAVAQKWQVLAPERFYLELQRLGRPGETEYLERAIPFSAASGLPLVATNEVCFLKRDDFEAHETRVCIGQGRTLSDPERPKHYTEEQFLKSAEAMSELFSELPEALQNTIEVAKRCSLELELGRIFMPQWPGRTSVRDELRQQAVDGMRTRLASSGAASEQAERYTGRLDEELAVISEMGFEGYFLIVADFISWARRNQIPVGPGRGSGAGSLVAYALGITNLDPIVHELLFERFLNPERVSLPDFDIDFCILGRDRVIEYVSERYGRDRVSQIVTFGTMAARAVVRDVGRVLGMPFGYVDRIAKLIPFELGITLDKALQEDEELRSVYQSEDEVRGLIDLAKELEGLARNVGTHAGGVVIAPEPLTEFMPLYSDAESTSLTQLDKDDLERIGLVKFDFLGLKTLTIIDKALAAVNEQREANGEQPIDLDAIGVDDPATYALLNTCRTTAVFQLESRGMRDLIKRLKPDCFDDLVAILALFRPGPLQSGMVDEFIDRKHGRHTGAIDYLHPRLEPVLKPTYGVILYQEQVMQIAQVLSGYSLGGADLLRRAMGKKKPEEMAKQRAVFLQGASAQEIEPGKAAHIFDLMEKFAGYGFNKSHSAAYALVAFQTAWLKAHYPEAFMAAVMTADMDNTDKLVVLKDDCTQFGIDIDPPNVNASEFGFAVGGDRKVKYGLGAIKGVGQSVVEAIVAERSAHGPFGSLLDLCRRLEQPKLNRRVLEALVRAGALDGLGMNRATLMAAISDALRLAERSSFAAAAGQANLFGGADPDADLDHEFTVVRDWSKRERLEAEQESLGLFLTGHPFDDYVRHCRYFSHGSIANVMATLPPEGQHFQIRRNLTLAGVVMNIRRRGNRVTLDLDDNTGRIEATLFEEIYNQSKHLIGKHAILVIDGQLRFDDFLNAWRLTAQKVRSIDGAIEEYARRITICWSCQEAGPELVTRLKETLQPFRSGQCEVCVHYRSEAAEALLTLGEEWTVRLTRELREQLGRMLGEEKYSIHYAKNIV